jgi:molybdenum cofactor sulfurtransferase
MAESNPHEILHADEGYADFIDRYPGYVNTVLVDKLRATEYRRLDERHQVYLDYTGGSLYAESQLQKHFELLRSDIFGNPHSANPTSAAMTEHVERTRRYVLEYFNAAADYILVFTQNASGALKLVGESFPFAPGSRYLLTFDNHNSVNGIREFARAKDATVAYAPLATPGLNCDMARLDALLDQADPAHDNLFAYPAQSNFSGVKHPLDLVTRAKNKGWDVLLDAAAFVPTNRLDLTTVKPDFVSVSFYKMFGYPTGVGALLIRRPVFAKLKRPWFAGGTINFASVQGQAHVLSANEAAFEEGTLNYLSIPAVEIGLRYLQTIGLELIAERIRCLTGWLLDDSSGAGKQRLGHISKQGSPFLRGLLVEAAQTAVRYEPEMRRAYQRLAQRKCRALAKVAMARKLAVRLYWMLRLQVNYAQLIQGSHAGQPGTFCGRG